MKSSVELACGIIDALKKRSGFDGWWDSVDDETRDEILTRLSSIIGEEWPRGPQAPIAQLTINDAGEIAGTLMYAPGLPPGDHDLYCEPEALGLYLRADQPPAGEA
jgi:hypothetical protein